MRKWFFLATFLVAGCGDDVTTQTVEVCTNEAADPYVEGAGGSGVGGAGGSGGDSMLLGDGASCDDGAQCESATCLPSKNSFGSGVCYSSAMAGCIVITEPSAMMPKCSNVSKRLYVCGDYDVTLLGTCVDVGAGAVGEHYQCCDKPGFP